MRQGLFPLILLLGLSLSASASVTYTAEAFVQAQGGLGPQDSEVNSAATPVDASAGLSLPPVFSGTSDAASASTTIGGSVSLSKSVGGSGNIFGSAFGSIVISDLIVTKLPGFEGLPDTVDITVAAMVDYTQSSVSSTSDDLRIRLGFGVLSIGDFSSPATGAIVSHSSSIVVGTPMTLEFSGFLDGNANGGNDTTESVIHQFTASLNANELLQLPEGYTVNATGVVVDNQVIPEPTIPMLSVLGAMVLLVRNRTR